MKLVNVSENITIPEEIEKVSKEISNYYPNYNKWIHNKMILEIIDQTRKKIWFISLKKEEKKICTIFVEKIYKTGI